ncbi:TlpA disulfide reductase family protein [Phaeovulum sp. W22_SRMD_FR3]|uniref:TlpA disulfide reductase family protein n=1 Tax=Phaeovulum sp. W22_SRMD_FR3 TaxID=3240274 RepID=UPI003F9709C4
MVRLSALALYTALGLCANLTAIPAMAADLTPLRSGAMNKLVIAEAPAQPENVLEVELPMLSGGNARLADYQGKVVLVNFWATWCAPCRKEMPALAALQSRLGGDDFSVVTVASGRNPEPAIQKFFAEAGVEGLPVLRDERQSLARQMGVLGLPVSVLFDREGREVARLIGDAAWDGPEAEAVIRAVMGD